MAIETYRGFEIYHGSYHAFDALPLDYSPSFDDGVWSGNGGTFSSNTMEDLKKQIDYHIEDETGLKFIIGDVVTFTNDYGVKFTGRKVTGFLEETHFLYEHGYRYYIESDAPWMPVKEESLSFGVWRGVQDNGTKSING